MQRVMSYGGLTRREKERHQVYKCSRKGFLKEPVECLQGQSMPTDFGDRGATDDDEHVLIPKLFVLVRWGDDAIWLRTNPIAASNHQSLNGKRYGIGLQTGLGAIRQEGSPTHWN